MSGNSLSYQPQKTIQAKEAEQPQQSQPLKMELTNEIATQKNQKLKNG